MVDEGRVCPECGSENVDCDDSDEGSDFLDNKNTCNDCGTHWTAHYKMTFMENQWIDGGVSS